MVYGFVSSISDIFLRHSLFSIAKRRADREGVELPTGFDVLKQYVDRDYFIHMTNDPSLTGINIKSKYSTPAGKYAYPLNSKIFNQLKNYSLPFLEDAKYIVIFKYTNLANALHTNRYTEENLKQDVEKLKQINNEDVDELYTESINERRVGFAASGLFYILLKLSGGNIFKFRQYFVDLGYSGVYDEYGVIHENEPEQFIAFMPQYVETIDIIKNPTVITYDIDKIKEKINIIQNKIKKVPEEHRQKLINKLYNKINRLPLYEIVAVLDNIFISEILGKLSKDHVDFNVIKRLAQNINTPPDVLTILEQHPNYYVRLRARNNPNNPRNKRANTFNIFTRIQKLAKIKQLSSGKWQVQSKKGRNLGTYDTKSEAEERLKQVEMFKHMDKNNASDLKPETSYSSIMRKLRKENPEKAKQFQSTFKEAFDAALINNLDEPANIALLHTLKNVEGC